MDKIVPQNQIDIYDIHIIFNISFIVSQILKGPFFILSICMKYNDYYIIKFNYYFHRNRPDLI